MQSESDSNTSQTNSNYYSEDSIISDERILVIDAESRKFGLMEKTKSMFMFIKFVCFSSTFWLRSTQYKLEIPILILIVAIVYYFSIRFHLLIFALGLISGLCYKIPEAITWREYVEDVEKIIETFSDKNNFSDCEESTILENKTLFGLSDPVEQVIDEFLQRLLNDLINPWYVPLCKSGDFEFQSCIRSTLNSTIINAMKIAKSLSKDTKILIIYGLTNALIIHMEEFKLFESSKLSIKEFISQGKSRRRHFTSFNDEMKHIKKIIGLLIKRLVPRQESKSIILNALLKEIISGNTIIGIIDRISDPDFINQELVNSLNPDANSISVDPGWNILVIKVLNCRNIPEKILKNGVYLVFHLFGRRIKTKRIYSISHLWNESFRFKISDSIKGQISLYVQMLQYNYMGKDISIGHAKISSQYILKTKCKPAWVKFTVKYLEYFKFQSDVEKSPEILVETKIISSENSHLNLTSDDKQTDLEISAKSEIDDSDINVFEDEYFQNTNVTKSENDINLKIILQNNELFVEFLEYLNSVKAPPYLQFLMNVDALLQFSCISLGIKNDDNSSEAIQKYFQNSALDDSKLDQLKLIKHDSLDVFLSHFTTEGKYQIPLDPGMQQELQDSINLSDNVDSDTHLYNGGLIGPNIFFSAYKWVNNILEEVYFPKFKLSESFIRFFDKSKNEIVDFNSDNDISKRFNHDVSTHKIPSPNINLKNDVHCKHDIPETQEALIENLTKELNSIDKKLHEADKTNLPDSHFNDLLNHKDLVQQKINNLSKQKPLVSPNIEDLLKDINIFTVQVRNPYSKEHHKFSKDTNFEIEVNSETISGAKNNIVIHRTLSDFKELHKSLQKQFSKMRQIKFQTDKYLTENSVQIYLEVILSDDVIRKSHTMEDFLSNRRNPENPSFTDLSNTSVPKLVKGAFKSASSLILGESKPMQDTQIDRFLKNRERHATVSNECLHSIPMVNTEFTRSRSRTMPSKFETEINTFGPLPLQDPNQIFAKIDSFNNSTESNIALLPDLLESELDMLIETVFAFFVEAFDLKEPNQWLRRKLLGVFKQIIKQAYGESLGIVLKENINKLVDDKKIINLIKNMTDILYEDGVFIKDRPPPEIRTDEEKFLTMIDARTLFLNKSPDFIQALSGRYNAICGMTRIFNSLQYKELNRTLIYTSLDIVIKLFFSDNNKA